MGSTGRLFEKDRLETVLKGIGGERDIYGIVRAMHHILIVIQDTLTVHELLEDTINSPLCKAITFTGHTYIITYIVIINHLYPPMCSLA